MNRTLPASWLAHLTFAAFLLLMPPAAAGQAVEVLHSFSGCVPTGCQDGDAGANPRSTLAPGPDGQFYGTARTDSGASGPGTLFKIASNGTMTVLFNFRVQPLPTDPQVICPLGCFPVGSLTLGSDGEFYGAAGNGGVHADGTLFRITTSGVFTKLHDFDDQNPAGNGTDGSGLTEGPDGRFYGVTQYGGSFSQSGVTLGTVFRLESNGTITTLHSFSGSDGQWPRGDLVLASDGNIYGTTWAGGGAGGANCPYNGCGTIFRLVLSTNAVQMVHAFGLTDGSSPGEGRLIQAADGSLYGTTESGGSGFANGTIFKVALDGTFTSLHSFTAAEGYGPRGSLFEGEDGNFYGTTSLGGTANRGTVFRMTPAGDVTVLHEFSGPEGARPFAGLAQGSDGHLYGTTYAGGANDLGVVFRAVLPRAQNGTLTVVEDIATNGTLGAIDPNNAPFTFSIVSNGLKGTATITDQATGAFTYVPNANATGADTFTFKANNGTMDTNVATISVTITPVNDSPVATNGTASTTPNTPVSGTVNATDVDSATLTYSIVTNGTKGTAVITNATTGAYTYTPQASASGTDTFTFKANDGSLDSNAAAITITIEGNSPPVASDGTLTTREDRAMNGRLSATDPEGQPLSFSVVSNPAKGTVTLTNATTGRFMYTPMLDAYGSDSFTFKTSDGIADSNVATVSVTITPVNDAPVALDGSITTQTNQSVSGALQATDVDAEALTFALARAPRRGTAVVNAAGGFSYTPNSGFAGSDSFRFRVADPSGSSSIATISITVTP
jgi:uncharacterized repeat protein (TIGR03803 family)